MPTLTRLLSPALALPALLAAQAPDSTPHKPTRLFRSREPLQMTLQADFKTVFRDRDSMSTKKYPATLKYVGEKGDTTTLEVQLATRGHYRLRTCEFLPLKVYFDKEKAKGTLFGGEASLKLTPHCMKGDRYSQNIYIEYAIYGMYNVLTPVSLKARLADITWLDPANPKFTITRPGFWTQDEDDMAKEVRGKILMQQGGHAEEMDARQMAITDVFQYMIGNTDYSLSYLHNYRIVQTDTSMSYYPMAYDFDWSGLVDAPYATPDYRLGIKRTTDRLYRGGCHPPEVLSGAVEPFKARKDSIYGQLRAIKGLSPARLKEAEGFLDEFYKELNDPGAVRRVFNQPCSH
ncbi:MAG TPA: hypothetical protein VL241_08675 [Gemmatimonadales bacterium]|nr:hypothetical protein [Gemmatimonadales bacterium]